MVVGNRRAAEIAALRRQRAAGRPVARGAGPRQRPHPRERRGVARARGGQRSVARSHRHPHTAVAEQRHRRQLQRLAAGGPARASKVELRRAARAAQQLAASSAPPLSGPPHAAHALR